MIYRLVAAKTMRRPRAEVSYRTLYLGDRVGVLAFCCDKSAPADTREPGQFTSDAYAAFRDTARQRLVLGSNTV